MEILRTCCVTNQKINKNELFRICKTKSGLILVDINQNIPGRGGYLIKDKAAILKAKKKHCLSRVLRCEVKDEIYDELLNLL